MKYLVALNTESLQNKFILFQSFKLFQYFTLISRHLLTFPPQFALWEGRKIQVKFSKDKSLSPYAPCRSHTEVRANMSSFKILQIHAGQDSSSSQGLALTTAPPVAVILQSFINLTG